ncbi:MarR family winged helix-turn-helix transcriptional regulator [Nocardia donostiensis]|uniref:MarR family transcriptional regulator n=1 Tax=Nocardia donostiensis TaxID=1538463 RepID=A0A1V2TJC4_9NOCA|nr:MarR family transcriptional regulator [Nocardia donostiensis]ONM49568.1 MarR family transcriptional regulator [Nocardia donostiensis]OQS12871.1 MarR family transcriptional regulator [Nocardia donostiensis]OQS19189.1 MarR family transcriptional regulator [Nocardia donostiensis]
MDATIWDQVVTLHGMVTQRLAKEMQRRHSIGLSEYQALCRLARAEDGELRMQELTELIGLNQSSVSRLAARLESAGLTHRDLCPKDRRGVYLVISEEGRALQQRAEPTYQEVLTKALDEASADARVGELVAKLRA